MDALEEAKQEQEKRIANRKKSLKKPVQP